MLSRERPACGFPPSTKQHSRNKYEAADLARRELIRLRRYRQTKNRVADELSVLAKVVAAARPRRSLKSTGNTNQIISIGLALRTAKVRIKLGPGFALFPQQLLRRDYFSLTAIWSSPTDARSVSWMAKSDDSQVPHGGQVFVDGGATSTEWRVPPLADSMWWVDCDSSHTIGLGVIFFRN